MEDIGNYDLIVIGGGSAGQTAATVGGRLGVRVLLVDKEQLGGDCLHYGCVPSKALISTAKLAHRMRGADRYALKPVALNVDISGVMARIAGIKKKIGSHESPDVFSRMGVDVKFGGARFIDRHTIAIGGDKKARGKSFVICTGSSAVEPPIPGLSETGSISRRHRGVGRNPAIIRSRGNPSLPGCFSETHNRENRAMEQSRSPLKNGHRTLCSWVGASATCALFLVRPLRIRKSQVWDLPWSRR